MIEQFLPLAQLALPPINEVLAMGLVIFLAIGIHEYAHCKMADVAGDPTPRMLGRVTLNLTKHFEPLGTMMIIFTTMSGFGFGWGKPAPMNPARMRNPKWDHFFAVIAGPLSNILQAAVWAIVLRLVLQFGIVVPDFISMFLYYGVLINLFLAFFNMLPIGPLDGMWIISTFMPDPMADRFRRFNLTTGIFLFIGFILVSQMIGSQTGVSPLGAIIFPPVNFLFRFLVGPI